jgi:hypothetical protein
MTTQAHKQFLADQRALDETEQQLVEVKAWQRLGALEEWNVAKGWLLSRIAAKQTKLLEDQRPSPDDFIEIRAEIRTLRDLLFVVKRDEGRVADLEKRAEDLRASVKRAQNAHQDRDYSRGLPT